MKILKLYQVICLFTVFLVSQICETTKPDLENKSSKSLECNVKKMKLLQQVLQKDVLSTWPLKKHFSSLRDLHLDKRNFWSVIKHENNERLQRTTKKILQGKPVNVFVYGGSNTAGGGLQEDEKSIKGRFPLMLQNWWDSVITPASGSRLNMKIIGIGGTSSGYYQFCYKVYLGRNNIDLVILDSSVNDGVALRFKNSTNNQSLPLEQFTRQLLNDPNHPAVMFVNFFLTTKKRPGCFNLINLGQSLVSNHYNITTFDLRNLACEFKSGKFHITAKTAKYQTKDKYHMSLLGHAQTAFMIIQVIRKSMKRLLNDSNVLTNKTIHDCTATSDVSYEPIPPPMYIKPISNVIKNSLCWTKLAPDKKYMIRNTLKVSVLKRKGFDYTENVPILSPSYRGKPYRTDCYSCWSGRKKGSEITFSFEVPDNSSVSVFTRSNRDSGELQVWLDNDINKSIRIYPKTRERQTVIVAVANGVTSGNHTLTVRITKDGNVPVVGIAVAE